MDLFFTPYTKVSSTCTSELNISANPIRILGADVGVNLRDQGGSSQPGSLRGTTELAGSVHLIQDPVLRGKPVHWPVPTNKTEGCGARNCPGVQAWAEAAATAAPRRPPLPAACPHQGSGRMERTLALDDNQTSDRRLFRWDRGHSLTAQSGGIITEWHKRSKIIPAKP